MKNALIRCARRMAPGLSLLLAGPAPGRAAPPSAVRRTPVVAAVEKALPGVVNIGTERLIKVLYTDPRLRSRGDYFDQLFSQFFGWNARPGYQVSSSLGSGVLVDPRGFILTNHHVIERASVIRVTLADESQYTARLIAGDEVNDLALLKIEPTQTLHAVTFAADDDLLLGETVIAMGNPFGLAHTVTVGVLSARDREARNGDEVLFRDILQTDAAVNPGSSGGPLLNLNGELIGINVAIYQDAQNIGFAIPIKRARGLLTEWLAPGRVNGLWLGWESETLPDGALRVQRVTPDGPAARVGLRAGDRLLALNGRSVDSRLALHQALLDVRPGDPVELQVARAEATITLRWKIPALPPPAGIEWARRRLGLRLEDPSELRRVFRKGVPIAEVTRDGPAAQAGLRAGHILTRINDQDIVTLDDVGRALADIRPGAGVRLTVVLIEELGGYLTARTGQVELTAR